MNQIKQQGKDILGIIDRYEVPREYHDALWDAYGRGVDMGFFKALEATTPVTDLVVKSHADSTDVANPPCEAHTQRKVIEALEELKRRWHEDRKTMDYSPATYDFIADKMINELKGKL